MKGPRRNTTSGVEADGGTTEVVADRQVAQSIFDKFCRDNSCRGLFRKLLTHLLLLHPLGRRAQYGSGI